MPQFLLELVSEEIPARQQTRAAENLKCLVCAGLAAKGLDVAEQTRVFVTPRRLALTIIDLPATLPDMREERRGPRTSASVVAITHFLKANNITLEQTEVRTTNKGVFYFAIIENKGGSTAALLNEVVSSVLTNFPWPKSMHWGPLGERWIRPLRSILCVFGNITIPIQFGGIRAGNTSKGHRFLAPTTFSVHGFEYYERCLREAYVILDQVERADCIRQQATALATIHGLTVNIDETLLAEITGLVEWPVVLIGRIDDAFMEVPEEVLAAIMRTHQKYLSLYLANGKLAQYFLIISNIVATDGGKIIVTGNERVLRARLSDAKFFWDQDRRQSLATLVGKLTGRIFHAKLGNMAVKVLHMRRLAKKLVGLVPNAEPALVDRAALLAKADLSTRMVSEFPELQGIIGCYYAYYDGETPEVCDAIAKHYAPLGPNEVCPSAPISVCVALSDKIDTLVSFWAIDEKPTGSKDPFALRRAALGVIRLIIENKLRIPLLDIFDWHYQNVCQDLVKTSQETPVDSKKAATFNSCEEHGHATQSLEILDFLADRLKVHLHEKGIRHDLITSIFVLKDEDDLLRLLIRVNALSKFLTTNDGVNLLFAYRRAMNIVRIEEKKDKATYYKPVDRELFEQDEEYALDACLSVVERASKVAVNEERFDAAMAVLSKLRTPVDAFFERVTVNSDNSRLRENRLKMLSRIGAAMEVVADFTKIEGITKP